MIRPSSLPKLQECPQFEGSPSPSPAAERGTRIDILFRSLIEYQGRPEIREQTDEDAVAKWAADYVLARSGLETVLCREQDCRIDVEIDGQLLDGGTCDAVCPDKNLLFDLKTGEIRDYYSQMAAYSLGWMKKTGATYWTAILVFADKHEIREYRYTIEGATQTVRDIVRERQRDNPKPRLCEYCGWCAKFDGCKAVVDAGMIALAMVPEQSRFSAVLADPAQLSRFLEASKVLEDWIEEARSVAKARLADGQSVPGWKIQTRNGRETVSVSDLISAGADVRKLLPETVSGKTAREALEDLPEKLIKRGPDILALVQQKQKTLKED
jgi:hypothetical protein